MLDCLQHYSSVWTQSYENEACGWMYVHVIFHQRRVNKPIGRLELDQQVPIQTLSLPFCGSLCKLLVFLCYFFSPPLVAPIRMIDEGRCRGDG